MAGDLVTPVEPGTIAKLRTLVLLDLVAQRRSIRRAGEIARLAGGPPLARDRIAFRRLTLPAGDAEALHQAIIDRPGFLAGPGEHLIVWCKPYPEGNGCVTVHVQLELDAE